MCTNYTPTPVILPTKDFFRWMRADQIAAKKIGELVRERSRLQTQFDLENFLPMFPGDCVGGDFLRPKDPAGPSDLGEVRWWRTH